jgi:N-methylhydantoinase B
MTVPVLAREEAGSFDPVDVEIFSKALENIASEMGLVMMRSSGSPVIAEAVDFSTFIADATGDIVAYAGYITMYLGTARQAVRHILATVPSEEIHAGDLFICNDPFTTGNAHQVDVGVVRPIFAGEELVAWCWAEAHVVDFGGIAPGGFAPMATETYGEALRLPGVKIVDRGRIVGDIWRIIETNIRVPFMVLNDIRCFIAACNRCDDRMQELFDSYGLDTFRRYTGIARQQAEAAVRGRIASLPDGTWQADEYVEHNGHTDALYNVNCVLTIQGDEMTFDFRRSAPQADGFINCSAAITLGCATTPLLISLLCDVPINQGTLAPISVLTTPGTVCDLQMPAPCSSGHLETGLRVCKVVTRLLAEVQAASSDPFIRDHVMAPWQDSWNGSVFYAPDESGQLVPFLDMHGGSSGGGAMARADGLDVGGALAQPQNSIPDIEINELGYPVLYLWRRINAASGGAGRHRGGNGVDLAWTPWLTVGGQESVFAACWQVPPPGILGGYPGAGSSFHLVSGARVDEALAQGSIPRSLADVHAEAVELASKQFGIAVGRGDILSMRSGGGGGLGDPLDRSVDEVANDLLAGAINPKTAEACYGAVIGTDGRVDATATRRRRGDIRAERSGWALSELPHELPGRADRSARMRVSPAAGRLGELGVWCHPRAGVELIEYADAESGELLLVDIRVSTDGELGA